jgi:hypothetical protein
MKINVVTKNEEVKLHVTYSYESRSYAGYRENNDK